MAKAKRAPQIPGAEPDPVVDVVDPAVDTPEVDPAPAEAVAVEVKAKKGKGPLTREDYAKMRAHEVDAKALTGSVLTLDGWVVPDLPPQAAIKA